MARRHRGVGEQMSLRYARGYQQFGSIKKKKKKNARVWRAKMEGAYHPRPIFARQFA